MASRRYEDKKRDVVDAVMKYLGDGREGSMWKNKKNNDFSKELLFSLFNKQDMTDPQERLETLEEIFNKIKENVDNNRNQLYIHERPGTFGYTNTQKIHIRVLKDVYKYEFKSLIGSKEGPDIEPLRKMIERSELVNSHERMVSRFFSNTDTSVELHKAIDDQLKMIKNLKHR